MWERFARLRARFVRRLRLATHEMTPRIDDAVAFAYARQVLLLRYDPTGTPLEVSRAWLPFEMEAIARDTEVDFGGVRIRVATAEDLIVFKARRLASSGPRSMNPSASTSSTRWSGELRDDRRSQPYETAAGAREHLLVGPAVGRRLASRLAAFQTLISSLRTRTQGAPRWYRNALSPERARLWSRRIDFKTLRSVTRPRLSSRHPSPRYHCRFHTK